MPINAPKTVATRLMGRGGPLVSAIGIGCWAIGGLSNKVGGQHGWGGTDDAESIRAVHAALDMGVTFLDTADVYGAGHSEKLLGQALKGRRDGLFIATKFSKLFVEDTRTRIDDTNVEPAYIKAACEGSLRRMGMDVIDLYQLHEGKLDLALVPQVLDTLEALVAEGKIKAYGWSTDDPERAQAFAAGPHCIAIQQRLNLFEGNRATLSVCEASGLASINRSPMAQGLLTGKFDAATTFEAFDVRAGWDFSKGAKAAQLKALAAVRELLTSDGRTLAQGALGWLLAVSPATIPIPGFKTVAQVTDNCGVLEKGPLSPRVMAEIEAVMASVMPAKAA
jgi:aryl-alcohol dehydrogenase-like predicted oxidoreductase